MKTFKFILFIAPLALLTHACKKDSAAGKSYYTVSMTDAPGDYDAVLVDVQGVEVKSEGKTEVMLNVKPGIYNLLELSGGKDTLIASGNLDAGTVSQIRLILGSNNKVVVDGDTFPLSTPSAEQSGLKLQVHQKLEAGVDYHVLLDFDAGQSIHKTGNGTYKLKPVVRTVATAQSGSIKGKVQPIGTMVAVTATANGVNYSTVADVQGNFVIKGLPAGTYDVTLTPAAPLSVVTKTNVVVQTGVATDLGIIIF